MTVSGCTVVQIIILVVAIPLICVLMTMPTIFYFTDAPVEGAPDSGGTFGNCSASEYNGSVCRDILLGYQSCIPGRANSTAVYISKGDTQTEREVSIQTIRSFLRQSTQECRDTAIPVLCLFFFGLCDENRNEYLPTRDECVQASETLCSNEWNRAMSLPSISSILPVCDSLPETTIDCDTTPPPSTPAPPPVNDSCSEYTGGVCSSAFVDFQYCTPGQDNSSAVYVSSDAETEVQGIIGGLSLINASLECTAAALPFFCQLLFVPCDDNGIEYLPSRSQCENVSLGVCAAEFQAAQGLGITLPQCDDLPDTTVDCDAILNGGCSEYTGSVCSSTFVDYQDCVPGQDNSSAVYVSSDAETEVQGIIGGLSLINASPECTAAALPFFCQLLLMPCDVNGTGYLPSRSQCENVSLGVCATEFQIAQGLGIALPECDDLPDTTDDCSPIPPPPVDDSCSEYTGSVCGPTFQDCIPGQDTVYVSNDVETQVQAAIDGLAMIGASAECTAAAIPLLCQYFFEPCDVNGTGYLPSRSQCENVSLGVCATEFQTAQGLGITLLQCDALPNTTIDCEATIMEVQQDPPLNCSEDFFYNADEEVCSAECGEWSFYSDTITKGAKVIFIILCCLAIVATTAVLILTCVRPRIMLKFPTVFSVYTSVSAMVLSIFFLIGYTDRPGLFCVSQELVSKAEQRVNGPSQFCTAIGVVFTYVLLQLACWWIFQVASVFCSAIFPSLYSKATKGRWSNLIIHLTVVGVCVVLPCIPFIVALSLEGFGDALGLAPLCTPQTEVTYYTLVLPISSIVAMGVCMGIIVLTQIIKLSCCSQEDSWSPVTESEKCSHVSRKSHLLTLIPSIHYIILALFYLSGYIWVFWRSEASRAEFFLYLLCEEPGVESVGMDGCPRDSFSNLTFPALFNLCLVAITLFPVSNLIYVLVENCTKERKRSSNGKLPESQVATIPLEDKPVSGTNYYSSEKKTSI